MNKFLSKYLTPTQTSKFYVGLLIVGVFVVAVGIMTILEPEKKERRQRASVENIITNKNSREFGLDAVNDQVTNLEKQRLKDKKLLDNVEKENAELKKSTLESKRELETAIREMKILRKEINDSKTANQKVIRDIVRGEIKESNVTANNTPKVSSSATPESKKVKLPSVDPNRRKVRNTGFSYGNGQADADYMDAEAHDDSSAYQANEPPKYRDDRTDNLFTIIEDKTVVQAPKEKEIYLPIGSILTGVIITGLDAPTQSDASSQPVPVLVRVKKEAILPNFATVNEVNECFAILGGYGDLSSERAFLRGESISCVKKDGTIIEEPFKAYAVGEDGKNGLKGTLVSRNSTVLANAMMAGFASGMASMFDVNPVATISTDASGAQQYKDVWSPDAIQGGAAKGASKAIEKLADYYMDLADAIHPIIEIGSGRVIDMVVTTGASLSKGIEE